MEEHHPNIRFLIEYKGEFYWNGRLLKKSDPERDPKLFWTHNFHLGYTIETFDKALELQRRYFNYPTRIVQTYID